MSEGNGIHIEELAYLLWEKQGRPENRSAENWLEAEFLARSLTTATNEESEGDLHMRGLGPLTLAQPCSGNGDASRSENAAEPSVIEQCKQGVSAPPLIATLLLVPHWRSV